MERILVALTMDLTDTAPIGAGWYINIITDGKHLMPPMPVTPETAYQLAGDFGRAMQESEAELPNFTAQQVVQTGNQHIHSRLQEQLAHAEAEAAKIASLRKRLAAAPAPTSTSATASAIVNRNA